MRRIRVCQQSSSSKDEERMADEQDEGPRQRYKAPWAPGGPEYDPLLPYGPKVYLARRKKPDSWWLTTAEVALTCLQRLGILLSQMNN